MKALIASALVLLALPVAAKAQEAPAVELSASYSFHREGISNGVNANGVSASLALNLNRWLGLASDFGYYHASSNGIGANTATYLFGPRFSYRRSSQVTPFAQVLLGG